MDTPDPLRYHKHYQDSGPTSPSYAGGSSFMERVSERVASGMGTVGFLVISSTVILAWVLANHVVHFLSSSWTGLLNVGAGGKLTPLRRLRFDPPGRGRRRPGLR